MADDSAGTELVTEPALDGLTRGLARLSGLVFSDETPESVLELAVGLAGDAVPGADAATVTVRREGSFDTSHCSDEAVRALDQAQYDTKDGPCVEALEQGTVVHAADGLDRWPALAEKARQVGVRRVLSTPLLANGEVVGSLNLYARERRFDEPARRASTLFAASVASAFDNALAYAAAMKLNLNLREAIDTREIIGAAKGILMARQNCTSDEAFDILRRASQRTNRKLRDIAAELVRSTEPKRPQTR